MPARLVVYRVSSWRHGDCLLRTLPDALAHAARDLDCARPGRVSITRERVSQAWWDAQPERCDHKEEPMVEVVWPGDAPAQEAQEVEA